MMSSSNDSRRATKDTTTDSTTLSAAAAAAAEAAANRITFLFETQSSKDYIGEEVSILEHSWQAYECAGGRCGNNHEDDVNPDTYDSTSSEKLQVAALLHDVGHMLGMEAGYGIGMEGCGHPNHEAVGGDFLLSIGVDDDVAWLVANHVNAKRYLVWKHGGGPQGYYELTEASRTTLRHQGGPMNDEEARRFESEVSPQLFGMLLQMRQCDEAAKVPDKLPKPSIKDIADIVYHHVLKMQRKKRQIALLGGPNETKEDERYLCPTGYRLSSEQLRFYNENGYLLIKGLLGQPQINQNSYLTSQQQKEKQYSLSKMADDLFANPGKDMLVHKEQVVVVDPNANANDANAKTTNKRVQICRVENFCKTVKEWTDISDLAEGICSELFHEKAVLFKDKLNYKLPGGGGFLPHQDATAYKPDEFASTHISVMVAIDGAKSDKVGPLQMAKGRHKEGVFANTKGVIDKDVEDAMDFEPLYVDPGDVAFFSSYAPHRSFENTSSESRRIAYLTYNKLSEGDFNERYYEAKLATFRDGTGGTISINDDFGGTIVS